MLLWKKDPGFRTTTRINAVARIPIHTIGTGGNARAAKTDPFNRLGDPAGQDRPSALHMAISTHNSPTLRAPDSVATILLRILLCVLVLRPVWTPYGLWSVNKLAPYMV